MIQLGQQNSRGIPSPQPQETRAGPSDRLSPGSRRLPSPKQRGKLFFRKARIPTNPRAHGSFQVHGKKRAPEFSLSALCNIFFRSPTPCRSGRRRTRRRPPSPPVHCRWGAKVYAWMPWSFCPPAPSAMATSPSSAPADGSKAPWRPVEDSSGLWEGRNWGACDTKSIQVFGGSPSNDAS